MRKKTGQEKPKPQKELSIFNKDLKALLSVPKPPKPKKNEN